jgi:biotin operon repressor
LKLADAAGEISSGLLDLTREGGPGNFMVVSCGDIYVQFAGSPGNRQVLCESISGKYLPKKLKISSVALKKKLKALGFGLGGEIETYSRAYEVMTEKQARELAKLAVKILQDAYGVAKDAEVQIELSLE